MNIPGLWEVAWICLDQKLHTVEATWFSLIRWRGDVICLKEALCSALPASAGTSVNWKRLLSIHSTYTEITASYCDCLSHQGRQKRSTWLFRFSLQTGGPSCFLTQLPHLISVKHSPVIDCYVYNICSRSCRTNLRKQTAAFFPLPPPTPFFVATFLNNIDINSKEFRFNKIPDWPI